MPTHTEIARERELLTELGLGPVPYWPPRCTWYRPDGSVVGKLPCDPYSRLRYMSRGLRPDVADDSAADPTPTRSGTLLEAVVAMMNEKQVWVSRAA